MSEFYEFSNAISFFRSMETRKQLKLMVFALVNVAIPISKQLIFITLISGSIKILSSKSSETSILEIFSRSDFLTTINVLLALLFVLPIFDLIKLKSGVKFKKTKNRHTEFALDFILATLELLFAIILCAILIVLFSNLATCFILFAAFVIVLFYSTTFYRNPFIPKFLKRNFLQNAFSRYLGLTVFLILFLSYSIYSNSTDINAIHVVAMFLIPRRLFKNLAKWLIIISKNNIKFLTTI